MFSGIVDVANCWEQLRERWDAFLFLVSLSPLPHGRRCDWLLVNTLQTHLDALATGVLTRSWWRHLVTWRHQRRERRHTLMAQMTPEWRRALMESSPVLENTR